MDPRDTVVELPPGPGRKEPPAPVDPAQRPAVAPMVYVHERLQWEYKVVTRAADTLLNEEELNVIGDKGWELSGTVTAGAHIQFFFKRAKS